MIPISLFEQHINEICFLVDINFTYIQVVVPRVRWLRPLGYEINIDEVSTTMTILLEEDIDKSVKTTSTLKKKSIWP